MKNMVKGCLIGTGIIVLLWLCAPLLIGLMYAVLSRHQYNTDPPHKVSTLVATNFDIAVTLWLKQQPRAISYEGEYRVVEVVQRGYASQFYQILPTSAGDYPKLAMHWHPDKRILRFVDDGLRDGPAESRVDLNARTVVDAWRRASGETLLTGPRKASATFCFPTAGDRTSVAFTESDSLSLTNGGILVGFLENTEIETKQTGQSGQDQLRKP